MKIKRCRLCLLLLAGLAFTSARPLHAAEPATLAVDRSRELPPQLFSERPAGVSIDTAVIHFISAVEIDPAKAYDTGVILGLFHPDAAQGRPATSAHYLIERSGGILSLVPESKRAWHAGLSRMPPPDGRENVNDFSIGIEVVMTPKDTPASAQYEALSRLLVDLRARYPQLSLDNIVGHDTIRATWNLAHPENPAFVKTDPGPLFHWSRLLRRTGELESAKETAAAPKSEGPDDND